LRSRTGANAFPETFIAIVGITALAVVIDLVWKRLRPAELRPSPQSQLTQSTQA
jgi:hypothetical protein